MAKKEGKTSNKIKVPKKKTVKTKKVFLKTLKPN